MIEPPEGFDRKLQKNHVLKYDLKLAPIAWIKKLVNTLKRDRIENGSCIFFLKDLQLLERKKIIVEFSNK